MEEMIMKNKRIIKNQELHIHTQRVEEIAVGFSEYMKVSSKLLKYIKIGAKYHDIGKEMLNQNILYKEGSLTKEEFEHIKTHPVLGYNILKESNANKDVLEICLYHHEKYDGTGYPYGLKGREIPELARIIALCDAYDAMTSRRCYKDEMSPDNALENIKKSLGTHFDRELGMHFINFIQSKVEEISA